MSAPLIPTRILYYGRDEELPQPRVLRAGPLSAILGEGDLREIRIGYAVLLRRIYMAVRDRNWGTVEPHFSDLKIEQNDESFSVSFNAAHIEGEIDFVWTGVISGSANGELSFSMDGLARRTFWRNRIGFCVLHPAELAGSAAVVQHVDGSHEEAVFPQFINPSQPLQPFAEMRAVNYAVLPGVQVEVRFQGDIFEMEDQRNWTDASFKSFCTPLRLPYPVQIEKGTRIRQSIHLSLHKEASAAYFFPADDTQDVIVEFHPDSRVPLPALGLGADSADQPLSDVEIQRLCLLRLAHLRVDVDLSDPDWVATLERQSRQAHDLGLGLEFALAPDAAARAAVEEAERVLQRLQARVNAWMVYPRREIFAGGSPIEAAVSICRATLSPLFPEVPLFAGTNWDLIFMLRSMPPLEEVDGVCFSISPQIHAFDNASIIETLLAQSSAVESARHSAGGLPVAVSPVTLKPRLNVYASSQVSQPPPDQLPAAVDRRQLSLFTAGWTVGSLAALTRAGVKRATYYETTGWRGVMATQEEPRLPARFPSHAGQVFPVYHIFADVGEFAGGEVFSVRPSHPLLVSALGLTQGNRRRLVVASHSSQRQTVRLRGVPAGAAVRHMDETNAGQALFDPAAYRSGAWRNIPKTTGEIALNLLPYAVATVDWMDRPVD
ncbi:MAG: hypothetical protein B6D39_07950 [Anaerolineae bacterium UTCFX2]|nr:hypothetical protein [Anaerolineales bacterium]OQY90466.1 MAG: hypothetical protein B6D39_07950 [Anaerolineae bacterium UTCFX2]